MKLRFLVILFLFFPLTKIFAEDEYHAISTLPIQDGGRIKPFDTFAKEMLQLVYGKQTYEGRPAIPVVMTWLLQPEAWSDKKLFEIRFLKLKQALKLDEKEKHFTLKEILNSPELNNVTQDLMNRRQAKEKLDPYGQSIQRLESQVFVFKEISSGKLMRLVPPKEGDAWLDLNSISENLQPIFSEMVKSFIEVMTHELSSTVSADQANAPKPTNTLQESLSQFEKSVESFKAAARAENPNLYPADRPMNVEVHYNKLHPMQVSWIFYLIAALLGLGIWIFSKKNNSSKGFNLVWLLVWFGLFFNVYAMALRTYLMGRPPVTNMYETVVWVGFGAVLFSMIFEKIYKFKFIIVAGAVTGAFCLALADMAPGVLDKSLHPLEPVLRSNFWLMVHVMTITISYAAFFLALMLGNLGLPLFLKDTSENIEKRKALALSAYRCIQVGVALLGPGIILGGVWADYSWGRFWGWDPKETWALIAFLGYLAMLHGRIAGWIKDFGMLAFSIITFSLVVMAWYGVNFVLGAGLHSYGFGAGGVEYVTGFVLLQFLYVLVVFLKRTKTS